MLECGVGPWHGESGHEVDVVPCSDCVKVLGLPVGHRRACRMAVQEVREMLDIDYSFDNVCKG
ncbi:hypothetical protein EON65_20840 [archaeon]|nr:MAG: hypothetical protein EON65_20840 [archaeon]